MGKITISLSNDAEKMLRERSQRNHRSISKEIEHLIILLERIGGEILYHGINLNAEDKLIKTKTLTASARKKITKEPTEWVNNDGEEIIGE